jgi:hypothetical protein
MAVRARVSLVSPVSLRQSSARAAFLAGFSFSTPFSFINRVEAG